MTYVLGLETSCDETSVALLREDGAIAASVVSSQIGWRRASSRGGPSTT